MSTADKPPAPPRYSREVGAFLEELARTPARRGGPARGRLIFALDATASREPTWDLACHTQARMFEEARALGGLDVRLCFYRGLGELVASPWSADAGTLLARMTGVRCAAGQTQIVRVLDHARAEALRHRVSALVFVGDCMEEDPRALAEAAGRLGVLGVPAFMFHEGPDRVAGEAFKEVARLTHGAYCRFDAGSAEQLRELLGAVAVYASGGGQALERLGERRGGVARLLSHQMAKR
jgi:hypothetical protein